MDFGEDRIFLVLLRYCSFHNLSKYLSACSTEINDRMDIILKIHSRLKTHDTVIPNEHILSLDVVSLYINNLTFVQWVHQCLLLLHE